MRPHSKKDSTASLVGRAASAVVPTVTFAAFAAAIALTPARAHAQFPTTPPEPMPIEPAQFPPFQEMELENGLRILVVHNDKQPIVSITLAMHAGSYYDPAGKTGLAELTAGLLTKGADGRSANEIAAAIEGVGGNIFAGAGSDFLTVSASVLTGDRELAFDLLSDVVLRPSFPETELELLRKQTLSGLALEKSQPAAIASRAFARELYGEHPYGRRADEESVQAITRADLIEFQRERLRPAQALLVVAGALDSAEVARLATEAFAEWSGRGAAAPVARPAPQRQRTAILLVHKPGSVQSNIIIGNTTWLPNDTRGYALTVANQILGGSSGSRLFEILREDKGWTYGAYSSVTRNRALGSFSATAEVRTEVTDSSLVEMLTQMRRIGQEAVPMEEFRWQKQTLVGRFPLQVETASQVASQVANARLLGLPADYVQTYRERLQAVTPEQMQSAARSGIRSDAALVVVVGDGSKIADKLRAIAPVRMVDIEGNPMEASAVAAEVVARPLDLDLARMQASSDSFTVMVQGNPFGYQSSRLARDGDGWMYSEESMLGPIIQQRTSVRFGPDATMRSVTQSGTFQGQEMKLDVRYTGGTVSGSGITPGAQGMQPVSYDNVAIPVGTIDDNALAALLPYFKWAPGASFTVNVFASGKGVVEQRMLRVTGQEEVTVPAGTMSAYRVSYSGGDAPGTYWIEAAAPHRLLKFGPAGAPLEIVRIR